MASPRIKRLIVGRDPKRTLVRATLVALLGFIVFRYVFPPIRIPKRGWAFVNAVSIHLIGPRRGDEVAIEMAGRRVLMLKRIGGLPGERISLQNGILHVNGVKLESFAPLRSSSANYGERELGADEYFVMDDSDLVLEGAHFGRVPRSKIIGRLWF